MSYNNILDNPIFHTWKRADYGTDVGRVTERTIPDPAALKRGTKSKKKKKSPADKIEWILDLAYKQNRTDFTTTAQKLGPELLRIPVTEENCQQILRIYRKLTWLQICPRNYSDGLWEFSKKY